MARPTALTPEVEASILGHIRDGMSDTDSCALSHVSNDTFREWMSRGLGRDDRKPTPLYAAFAAKVIAARVECKERWIKSIENAGKEDWKAHKFLLAVRHPEEFSERVIAGKRLLAAMQDAKQAALSGQVVDKGEEAVLTEAEARVLDVLTRGGT